MPEGVQQSSQRCQSWTYVRSTRPCPEWCENCRGSRWKRCPRLETARAPFILCGASGSGVSWSSATLARFSAKHSAPPLT
eukprot:9502760-Pyramimonas_sp.AAC.1